MVPIFARIVGYGTPTVLVVATLVAYFPAFVLVSRGLASASRSKQDLLTVLGASRWTAFRLSAVGSVVGVLLAEFVVGSSGLGQLFVVSRVSYDMSRSWGAAIVATVLSLAFFGLASAVTRWLEAAYHDGSNGKG